MQIIRNDCTDPAYNLALEEYALTGLKGEYVLFWRNRESVILGKNQNSLSELDQDFVQAQNIQVVRRNSGGGAVFHDLGNINFTFVEDYLPEAFNNYAKFTMPIVAYLETRGIFASLSGRNDLLIGDVKVSGNAQAVRGGRLMHHGTLLYDANMGKLTGALKPKPIKHTGREIKSVAGRVANIKSLYPELPEVEVFLEELFHFFAGRTDISIYELTEKDREAILLLKNSKYDTWEWNFGETPKFSMEKSQKFDFGVVETCFTVNRGKLQEIRLFGDFFGIGDLRELEEKLEGQKFEEAWILGLPLCVENYISGMNQKELAKLLFSQ